MNREDLPQKRRNNWHRASLQELKTQIEEQLYTLRSELQMLDNRYNPGPWREADDDGEPKKLWRTPAITNAQYLARREEILIQQKEASDALLDVVTLLDKAGPKERLAWNVAPDSTF